MDVQTARLIVITICLISLPLTLSELSKSFRGYLIALKRYKAVKGNRKNKYWESKYWELMVANLALSFLWILFIIGALIIAGLSYSLYSGFDHVGTFGLEGTQLLFNFRNVFLASTFVIVPASFKLLRHTGMYRHPLD